MKYITPYLIFTTLVWLPWGLLCVFDTAMIENIIAVVATSPSANTDLRAMYGGVQTAVGLMCLLAIFRRELFPNVLFTVAFLGSGLALSRSYGLAVDESHSIYTWGVIGYEYFAAISSIVWLIFLSRQQGDNHA